MELTPQQIARLRRHLQEAGLRNEELSTELLDHLCCQLESAMQAGASFEAAQEVIREEYAPQHLITIEKQVQQAVQKPNAMQKVFILVSLLGSIFLTSYLLMPSMPDEVAASSPEASQEVSAAVRFNYPPLPPKASPLSLQHKITSSYGQRMHPLFKVRKLHTGVDFKAPLGTPVLAAGDGVVRCARDSAAWGLLIIIEHDSIFTSRYAHLQSIDVKEGDFIYAGEQIGTVGSTGKSVGPHLHYEIHQNGVAIDPEIYLPKP